MRLGLGHAITRPLYSLVPHTAQCRRCSHSATSRVAKVRSTPDRPMPGLEDGIALSLCDALLQTGGLPAMDDAEAVRSWCTDVLRRVISTQALGPLRYRRRSLSESPNLQHDAARCLTVLLNFRCCSSSGSASRDSGSRGRSTSSLSVDDVELVVEQLPWWLVVDLATWSSAPFRSADEAADVELDSVEGVLSSPRCHSSLASAGNLVDDVANKYWRTPMLSSGVLRCVDDPPNGALGTSATPFLLQRDQRSELLAERCDQMLRSVYHAAVTTPPATSVSVAPSRTPCLYLDLSEARRLSDGIGQCTTWSILELFYWILSRLSFYLWLAQAVSPSCDALSDRGVVVRWSCLMREDCRGGGGGALLDHIRMLCLTPLHDADDGSVGRTLRCRPEIFAAAATMSLLTFLVLCAPPPHALDATLVVRRVACDAISADRDEARNDAMAAKQIAIILALRVLHKSRHPTDGENVEDSDARGNIDERPPRRRHRQALQQLSWLQELLRPFSCFPTEPSTTGRPPEDRPEHLEPEERARQLGASREFVQRLLWIVLLRFEELQAALSPTQKRQFVIHHLFPVLANVVTPMVAVAPHGVRPSWYATQTTASTISPLWFEFLCGGNHAQHQQQPRTSWVDWPPTEAEVHRLRGLAWWTYELAAESLRRHHEARARPMPSLPEEDENVGREREVSDVVLQAASAFACARVWALCIGAASHAAMTPATVNALERDAVMAAECLASTLTLEHLLRISLPPVSLRRDHDNIWDHAACGSERQRNVLWDGSSAHRAVSAAMLNAAVSRSVMSFVSSSATDAVSALTRLTTPLHERFREACKMALQEDAELCHLPHSAPRTPVSDKELLLVAALRAVSPIPSLSSILEAACSALRCVVAGHSGTSATGEPAEAATASVLVLQQVLETIHWCMLRCGCSSIASLWKHHESVSLGNGDRHASDVYVSSFRGRPSSWCSESTQQEENPYRRTSVDLWGPVTPSLASQWMELTEEVMQEVLARQQQQQRAGGTQYEPPQLDAVSILRCVRIGILEPNCLVVCRAVVHLVAGNGEARRHRRRSQSPDAAVRSSWVGDAIVEHHLVLDLTTAWLALVPSNSPTTISASPSSSRLIELDTPENLAMELLLDNWLSARAHRVPTTTEDKLPAPSRLGRWMAMDLCCGFGAWVAPRLVAKKVVLQLFCLCRRIQSLGAVLKNLPVAGTAETASGPPLSARSLLGERIIAEALRCTNHSTGDGQSALLCLASVACVLAKLDQGRFAEAAEQKPEQSDGSAVGSRSTSLQLLVERACVALSIQATSPRSSSSSLDAAHRRVAFLNMSVTLISALEVLQLCPTVSAEVDLQTDQIRRQVVQALVALLRRLPPPRAWQLSRVSPCYEHELWLRLCRFLSNDATGKSQQRRCLLSLFETNCSEEDFEVAEHSTSVKGDAADFALAAAIAAVRDEVLPRALKVVVAAKVVHSTSEACAERLQSFDLCQDGVHAWHTWDWLPSRRFGNAVREGAHGAQLSSSVHVTDLSAARQRARNTVQPIVMDLFYVALRNACCCHVGALSASNTASGNVDSWVVRRVCRAFTFVVAMRHGAASCAGWLPPILLCDLLRFFGVVMQCSVAPEEQPTAAVESLSECVLWLVEGLHASKVYLATLSQFPCVSADEAAERSAASSAFLHVRESLRVVLYGTPGAAAATLKACEADADGVLSGHLLSLFPCEWLTMGGDVDAK